MTRVLILSSWVAHGHVGLSAAVPALQALGHEVTQLPTTVLSNHPGWPHVAGAPVPVDQIRGMIEALDANGWLMAQDALLLGYMPSSDHVALAADLARRMREAGVRVVVDPVLGDLPGGLYVSQEVACALRDDLVPLADVLTPNLFELGWLTGARMATLAEACTAASGLLDTADEVLVTSAPVGPGTTGLLRVSPEGTQVFPVALRRGVPHGVGDVFSALVAGGLSPGQALGHLSALIDASLHAPHLRIAPAAPNWTRAAALTPTEI
ncbi:MULTISPECIES: bifunctional hydroxymethylpyrimidine kinase/phosphomethylpyrimidine kinase [Mameliella]|uniref:bifunctional hydroxymethylpyrimidine kinase/phosphomethylpyrimidine kinase n=1 Tax=Mameliella TaxID=1434019 RepID=UPI000B5308EA|nr:MULTISPECIES: bifunctional hydroxymethylpyrimidine kinase/phosphomethylpyrimidine kinase [Mameliella]OWV57568.1 pyridoxal kinase [Mameliella alba]